MLRSTLSKALAASAAIVVGSLGLMMSPAGAGQPANQACLGASFCVGGPRIRPRRRELRPATRAIRPRDPGGPGRRGW